MEKCINLRNDFDENKCIKCGKLLSESWNYCPYCTIGVNVEICSCGKAVNSNWTYCPYCKIQIVEGKNISHDDGNEWLSKILNKNKE